MRLLGADAEMIEAHLDHDDERSGRYDAGKEFEVWPDCVKSLEFFLRIQTQWRHAGQLGLPTGLDYQGVDLVARSIGKKLHRRLFEDLQVMESAYLDECSKIAAADMRRREAEQRRRR